VAEAVPPIIVESVWKLARQGFTVDNLSVMGVPLAF
jgi:hypothetical protein